MGKDFGRAVLDGREVAILLEPKTVDLVQYAIDRRLFGDDAEVVEFCGVRWVEAGAPPPAAPESPSGRGE